TLFRDHRKDTLNTALFDLRCLTLGVRRPRIRRGKRDVLAVETLDVLSSFDIRKIPFISRGNIPPHAKSMARRIFDKFNKYLTNFKIFFNCEGPHSLKNEWNAKCSYSRVLGNLLLREGVRMKY